MSNQERGFDDAYRQFLTWNLQQLAAYAVDDNHPLKERQAAVAAIRDFKAGLSEKGTALTNIIDDKEVEIAGLAVSALIDLNYEPAITSLRQTARSHSSEQVRGQAYVALARLGDVVAIFDECKALLASENDVERTFAAMALSMCGTEQAIEALKDRFTRCRTSSAAREFALELAKSGDESVTTFLVDELKYEQDPLRRLIIASALSNIANSTGLEELHALVVGWDAPTLFGVVNAVQAFTTFVADPSQAPREQMLMWIRDQQESLGSADVNT